MAICCLVLRCKALAERNASGLSIENAVPFVFQLNPVGVGRGCLSDQKGRNKTAYYYEENFTLHLR